MDDKREDTGDGDSTLGDRKRRGDVRLRAPSGVVIDHSLPLHGAIYDQWIKGELSRVDGEGMPWQGDEYDLSDAWDRRGEESWQDSDDPHGAGRKDGESGSGDGEPAARDEGEAGDDDEPETAADPAGIGRAGAGTPQRPEVNKPGAIGEPARPAVNAPKKAWQEYAVAIGACEESDAAGMSRADLMARSTPPEMNPAVQGG